MIFSDKGFEKEISAVKKAGFGNDLPEERMQSIKQGVMQAISSPSAAAEPVYGWREKYHTAIRYAVSVIVGLSLVGGTTFASNGSVPGDPLYGIKLVKEKLQLSVALSDATKASLEAKFAENRLNELQSLIAKIAHKPAAPNQIINTAATSTISATSTDTEESNSSNNELEINAQANAKSQVNNAIAKLKQLQVKFTASGNTQAAADIQTNIVNLQNKAFLENLDLGTNSPSGDIKGESDDKRPNHGQSKGGENGLQINSQPQTNSSATPAQFKVNVKIDDDDADEHVSAESGD